MGPTRPKEAGAWDLRVGLIDLPYDSSSDGAFASMFPSSTYFYFIFLAL